MERIYATRIDDVEAVKAAGHDGVALCRTLFLSLLESAFHGGLFHGDLHAGNVLVDADGKLVLLDFGIVGRFTPRTRRILRQLVVDLIVRKDYESAGRAIFLLGAVHKPGSTSRAAPTSKVAMPLTSTELGEMSHTDLGRPDGGGRQGPRRPPAARARPRRETTALRREVHQAPRATVEGDVGPGDIRVHGLDHEKEAERDRRADTASGNTAQRLSQSPGWAGYSSRHETHRHKRAGRLGLRLLTAAVGVNLFLIAPTPRRTARPGYRLGRDHCVSRRPGRQPLPGDTVRPLLHPGQEGAHVRRPPDPAAALPDRRAVQPPPGDAQSAQTVRIDRIREANGNEVEPTMAKAGEPRKCTDALLTASIDRVSVNRKTAVPNGAVSSIQTEVAALWHRPADGVGRGQAAGLPV